MIFFPKLLSYQNKSSERSLPSLYRKLFWKLLWLQHMFISRNYECILLIKIFICHINFVWGDKNICHKWRFTKHKVKSIFSSSNNLSFLFAFKRQSGQSQAQARHITMLYSALKPWYNEPQFQFSGFTHITFDIVNYSI